MWNWVKDMFQIYWGWFSDQMDFMKTIILPIVIASVITWYLSEKVSKKDKS